MIRKISFLLLAIAILVTGVIAFGKLGYWERSVKIFSISPEDPSPGERGSGRGEKIEFAGPEGRDLPEYKKEGSIAREERFRAGSFREGKRNGEGRRGGELRGGRKINLRNVLLFLSVFAAFTVTGLCVDRGISWLRKRRTKKEIVLKKI